MADNIEERLQQADEELEEYLGEHLDWQVKGKPRGPLDETSTLRLIILQF